MTAISHVRDTDLLLDKIKVILRPQGKLFIEDGNNEAFFASRFARRRLWEMAEYGPIPENEALHGRSVDRLPFFQDGRRLLEQILHHLMTIKSFCSQKKRKGCRRDVNASLHRVGGDRQDTSKSIVSL